MHQTLYRKWRPLTFDDVCGQEHVTSILRYQIAHDKTSHAYLFCGSRGTGKTTCAKLLARALNCEKPENGNPCGVCTACRGILSGAITDVIEMDAASNNGVDNIRDIRDDVAYAPSECRKRVFIIDEVHMLSTSAFNALLKTLEEPPEHIVFILATTEMHKIPATILSRCQRYDFRRIESSVIVSRLRTIADSEHIVIDDDALYLIAKLSAGGMRDAIGMLELCAGSVSQNGTPIDTAQAAALLGTSPMEDTAAVVEAVCSRDLDALFHSVDRIYKEARDIGVFWQSLISFYRDMLVVKSVADPAPLLDLPEKQHALPVNLAKKLSLETILHHTRILDEVYTILQKNTAPARITVEMALVRMCDASLDHSPAALLARLSALEDRVAIGLSAAQPAKDAPQISPTADNVSWDMPGEETLPPSPAEAEVPPVLQMRKQDTPKKEPAASVPPNAEKKVLRAFRGWQEAVKKIERGNPMIGSFLREYKTYTCEQDGKFYLHANNAFSIKLITTSKENIEQILMAVNVVSANANGKKYTENELVFDSAEKRDTSGYEMIDDIIENAGLTTEEASEDA